MFSSIKIGTQRGEGLSGALVIREPAETNPLIKHYDYDLSEHIILMQDTTVVNGLEKYLANQYSDGNNKPDNILINGKGRYKNFTGEYGETVYTPVERFVVKKVCIRTHNIHILCTFYTFQFV